jgi:hypothetical protein
MENYEILDNSSNLNLCETQNDSLNIESYADAQSVDLLLTIVE